MWVRPIIAISLAAMSLAGGGCTRRLIADSAHHRQPYVRRPFLPVDEARQDPGFLAFRTRLLAALKARDLPRVVASAAPEIRRGLEVSASIGAQDSDWMHLERLLALGGSFTTTRGAVKGRREFCAPYVYSVYPARIPDDLVGEVDPWVIIAPRVALRSEPRVDAPVLLWLSHELVRHNSEEREVGGTMWYGVGAYDGREGWVQSSEIRDPDGDYHACFADTDGQWLITAFDVSRPRPRSQ